MLNRGTIAALLISGMALISCKSTTSAPAISPQAALAEVAGRQISFPNYPQAGTTYLSFSGAHGFQVNYLAPGGKAWLWYPGNKRGVPEQYKRDVVAGTQAMCWRHPNDSYNPVTKQSGGKFACEKLEVAQKSVVAELTGDPFNLASGQVPYPLQRCTAPESFQFDRARFGC